MRTSERTISLSSSMRAIGGSLIALLLLQGCLTIEENYTFRKDGSGTMEYVLDMSEIGHLMKGLPGKDKDGKAGDDGLGKMDLSLLKAKLATIPGISRVKMKQEEEGFIQRLSFRFKDLAGLNAALVHIMADSTTGPHEFFRWEGATLVRTSNGHARGLGGNMGGETGDSTDLAGMLETMHYKFSFSFPEDVEASSVAAGMNTETVGARQVRFNTDWSVITKDPAALDLRIRMKR